jgi:hypothetical protein
MPAVATVTLTGATWLSADQGSALFDGKPGRASRIRRTSSLAITITLADAVVPGIIAILGLNIPPGVQVSAAGASGTTVRLPDGSVCAWLFPQAMDAEVAMLGKVGRAREVSRRQMMNERDMRQELQKAVEAAGSKEELARKKGVASYEAYEQSMLAAARASADLSLRVEEAAANVEAWANVLVYGVGDAADAMADFVADGLRDFDNLWDDLKDAAKRGLRDLTREQQQQARRLAEAGAKEVERIKEALEPRKPPVETKPRPRGARKGWVRAGLRERRGW